MSAKGRVALVGAGPGDPALLTVRAAELLRMADVVAYDELVSESILALVPAHAELLAVGRRAGRGDTGYRIHPEVLARAREGHFVVRLKAGDPLVFGRGGEEAEELAAAGIPFEIVPGITAALGAAACSGIPLTHRGLATQVVLATGHSAKKRVPSPAFGAERTLVLYMAAHDLASNLTELAARGWPASTPAALVVAASTVDEDIITGTVGNLATLAATFEDRFAGLPALVVVGDVVQMRSTIEWRARLPLRGRRIIVARHRSGFSRVAAELRTRGADVVELPLVERSVVPPRERRIGPARWPSRIDLVVLPTPPAARAIYAGAPRHVRMAPAVALDARTQAVARNLGVGAAVAPNNSIDALITATLLAIAPNVRPPRVVAPSHLDRSLAHE